MKYTVWAAPDGTEYTVVVGDGPLPGDTPGMVMVHVIEAPDWEAAMHAYYAWQVWGPYHPAS